MDPRRIEYIEDLANVVRSKCNASVPVNVNSIVNALNGEVQYATFNDYSVSGKIERKNNSFVITCNKMQSDKRSVFTVAHELGHLFLHMGFILDDKKWEKAEVYEDCPAFYRYGYSVREYEANWFAGTLLMPKKDFYDLSNTTKDVDVIADHFGVSYDAALTRGKYLGVFDW